MSAAVSLSTFDEPTPEQECRAMLRAAIDFASARAADDAEIAEALADFAFDVSVLASEYAGRSERWSATAARYSLELAERGEIEDALAVLAVIE